MFDLPKYGNGVCLARLTELLEALSIDRARLQQNAVVVTGSNGKGSTAAFCAGIGRAYGLRTGLFTSPHLYRFNERFQIDGVSIDNETLSRLIARIAQAIAEVSQRCRQQFGAFEAQFALACLYFQEADCDFMVFEAGIGGRYDPARLVGARQICVTSVDFEHVELLGNSLELICSDKSDACAAGGTIVYGENCRDLRPHLLAYNRHRDVESLFVRDDIGITDYTATLTGQNFGFRFAGYAFAKLDIGLQGTFQINNAAIAAALFLLWLKGRADFDAARIETAVKLGLAGTRWPGRLEVIQDHPLTVVDVGHTPDGIQQALASLTAIYGNSDWILVVGVSRDKKADEIVRLLAPSFDTIVCARAHHKGADAEAIAAAARAANASATVHVAATIDDAVQISRELARGSKRKIYVAGGLFLAIEYATVVRGGRTQDLDFF